MGVADLSNFTLRLQHLLQAIGALTRLFAYFCHPHLRQPHLAPPEYRAASAFPGMLPSSSIASPRWHICRKRDKKTMSGEEDPWECKRSTESGAGLQFLPIDSMAKAAIKGVVLFTDAGS